MTGGSFFIGQDVDIKWVEYQNMIKYLSQWIKHNVAVMSNRSFPNNPAELKVCHHKQQIFFWFITFILQWILYFYFYFLFQALYTQYIQFKEHEIPQKENEKTKIQNLYKMLEVFH